MSCPANKASKPPAWQLPEVGYFINRIHGRVVLILNVLNISAAS
uniref:Uncharacterized protein n=1 Tax=Setaria italica TaxID=4555 RepID=K4A427_SETIT